MALILVYDIAASTGGAVGILEEFYGRALEDTENDYCFVLGTYHLEEKKNISVLRFPSTKKSWLHRLCFDYFRAPKLVELHNVDKVLSLQNTIIPRTGVPQVVYEHNVLPKPFTDTRFTFKQAPKLWVYQNIIGRIICRSLCRADEVIVQTQWMKRRCISNLGISEKKIKVMQPRMQINMPLSLPHNKQSPKTPVFFYPASAEIFKNHEIIVEAVRLLKNESDLDFRVIFTLESDANRRIEALSALVKEENLPIAFSGWLSRDQVHAYYGEAILLFPSYVESFPLPLCEAMSHNAPMIVSDCEYAREALSGYMHVDYIDPYDARGFADCMSRFCDSLKV